MDSLNSFWGIGEIVTNNKTKEDISESGPLRVTSGSCACEPVPEVETDVSDSGA